MRKVQPRVFLIGRTQALEPGIEGYLSHIGAKWKHEWKLSGAEILTEVYGRTCYRSFDPGMNANVKKVREGNDVYIANIIKSKHGSVMEHGSLNFMLCDVSRVFCYEENTKVLTVDGWKLVQGLTTKDRVLTLESESGRARWSDVLSMHEFDYSGDMMGWSTSQMQAPGMTPDHLLWAAPFDLRRLRGQTTRGIAESECRKIPIQEVMGKRFVIRKDIPWHIGQPNRTIDLGGNIYDLGKIFSWLGWMATDGGFSVSRPNQCTIVQSKSANLPVLRELMDHLFLGRWREHGPYLDGGSISFTISDAALAEYAKEMIGISGENRKFSVQLLNAGTLYLRAFWEAAIMGDGTIHHKNGHISLYCSSREASEQYQVIGAMLGMPTNMRIDDRVGQSHLINGVPCAQTAPSFILDFSRRGGGTLIQKKHQMVFGYHGKVYCPKTRDGIIFVKQTGHPFWSGNTHELVRHRVGTAFSQESLRYVRLTDLGLWIPPDIAEDNPKLVEVFEQYFKSAEHMQLELARVLDLDNRDFETKKTLTSFMRRVAPEGLATTIGFTANHRTLRHLIQLRTEGAAEAEIRHVFAIIGTICKAECPNIYQDFTFSQDGWTTDNRKI